MDTVLFKDRFKGCVLFGLRLWNFIWCFCFVLSFCLFFGVWLFLIVFISVGGLGLRGLKIIMYLYLILICLSYSGFLLLLFLNKGICAQMCKETGTRQSPFTCTVFVRAL